MSSLVLFPIVVAVPVRFVVAVWDRLMGVAGFVFVAAPRVWRDVVPLVVVVVVVVVVVALVEMVVAVLHHVAFAPQLW